MQYRISVEVLYEPGNDEPEADRIEVFVSDVFAGETKEVKALELVVYRNTDTLSESLINMAAATILPSNFGIRTVNRLPKAQ